MLLKILMLIFSFLITINVSISWSNVINTIINPSLISPTGGLKPDLIEAVAIGAQIAIDGCKEAFQWDRWNCPESSFSRQFKQSSTKEIAYTEAIVAAGVVYSITTNCSRGELNGCGCNENYNIIIFEDKTLINSTIKSANDNHKIEKDWFWDGCSDDTTYGEQIVLKFLQNSNEKTGDIQTFIKQHNNRIGREIVRKLMIRQCRCHGIHSCTIQSCWMRMPPFRIIAQELRGRYLKASRISYNNLATANRIRQDLDDRLKNFDNLVYFDESPNYCVNNNKTGWPGTQGRMCTKNDQDLIQKRSCKNLCRSCGYRVRKEKKSIHYRCNCKFIWCCDVTCDLCHQQVDEFFCE